MGIGVLSGLLDDKLIKILGVFMNRPDKRFYLTEVSKGSGVNAATTFRALNKLVKEHFIRAEVIGKVRTYRLSNSEKARKIHLNWF